MNKKTIFFLFVFVIFMLTVLETSIYVLYKFGKIDFINREKLLNIVKSHELPEILKPLLIPHPYFGYTYSPNNRFFQNTYLESNSDGFIDEEFPVEKNENMVVYGIIGGSAASSWGVEKREERINYQLEILLNKYAKETGSSKKYRILNMGAGSYIQYQATQVFIFYKNLLDGVIIYSGHNEIAHGIILTRDVPLQYPWTDLLTTIQSVSPLKYEISYIRERLNKYSNFLLKNPYLLYSPSIRFLSNRLVNNSLKKIENLNDQLQKEVSHDPLYITHIKRRRPSYSLPEYNHQNFLQDEPKSVAVQMQIMKAVVPLVYTEPIIDVYAIARTRGIHFLNIIQPMMLTVDREMTPKDLENTKAVPVYEKTGLGILREEADKMKAYGIETYDLNKGVLFKNTKNAVFIDPVHLTAEGNKIVANYLFELIKEKWLNNSEQDKK